VITGVAHTAVCVPDVEAAVDWYRSVLGLTVLSPPYLVEGEAIERDMGELIPASLAVKAAIVGLPGGGDRAAAPFENIEVIEYPRARGHARPADATLVDHGLTHVGLVCDDIVATRAELEARGVRFLTRGIAEITGLRTTWFADPYGLVFTLIEKSDASKPYYVQY
jgi:catechol 2,3-dioxygenase-like lactoylglutathione lyase family enzyme